MINSNFWKDKKVLITGFSGFKGFWLNLILSKLGSDVHGISKKEISSEIFNLYNNIQQSDNNNFIDLKDSENLLLYLNKLNPESLGELISYYEHKTFVLGLLTNVNSFDQWAVEIGKVKANDIYKDIRNAKKNKKKVKNLLIRRYLD